MPFCGQCGFQLPPRVNHCPRCGAVTEMNTSLEEAHPNDPTVAFLPPLDAPTAQPTQPAQWPTALPTIPSTPAPAGQQKLDLRPDGTSYDASQLTDAPTYQINSTPPAPVSQPGIGSSYPGYPDYTPTSGANYPPQRGDTSYPGFQTQQPQSSPGFMSPGGAVYQPISNSFGAGQQAPQKRGKAGLIVLLVLLLAILIIAGVAGAFVLKQPAILFNNGTGTATHTGTGTATNTTRTGKGTATGTTPTVVPSPLSSPIPLTQQAQTLVQHYYDDINNKNYQRPTPCWEARCNKISNHMISIQPGSRTHNKTPSRLPIPASRPMARSEWTSRFRPPIPTARSKPTRATTS